MIFRTPVETPRTVGSPIERVSPPHQRCYQNRVRTGCLTCRTRKVKCGEERPICRNCSRLERTCLWRHGTSPHHDASSTEPVMTHVSAPSPQATGQLPGLSTPQASSPNLVFHEQSFFLNEASGPSPSPSFRTAIVSQPTQSHCTSTSLSPDAPLASDRSRHGSMGLSGRDTVINVLGPPTAESMMTSQDIYLCTTIDLMAATQVPLQPSFTYFVQHVNPPIISEFDHVNWARAKMYLAQIGSHVKAVEAAILALQTLYKVQSNGLPTKHSLALYSIAMDRFQTACENDCEDFDDILAAAFLLCLFEMILPEETGSIFAKSEGTFLIRLAMWSTQQPQSHMSSRIGAWLTLCHASARRGGNPGILSDVMSSHFGFATPIPNLPMLDNYTDAPTSVYDTVSAPIFAFFLELQKISGQIANFSHYHRSRFAGGDQEEVAEAMAVLKARMYALWQTRPGPMQLEPHVLRSLFCPAIAEPLVTLIGICNAAYWTEIVEYGRTLSDPPLASAEAKHAMGQIRDIVDDRNWNGYSDEDGKGKLNSGYLRPLFLYAIESRHTADVQWAVDRMKQIRNSISRSDFFATFAESHAEAQRSKGRRVTTKYFCYQTFGVAPPFL